MSPVPISYRIMVASGMMSLEINIKFIVLGGGGFLDKGGYTTRGLREKGKREN